MKTISALKYHSSMWKLDFKVNLKQKLIATMTAHYKTANNPQDSIVCTQYILLDSEYLIDHQI